MARPDAHINVITFDGQCLPFDDGSWESVLLCDVLHHTDDPVGLLKEAVRVASHSIVIKDHVVRGVLARPTLQFMDFVGNAPHGVALPYNYLSEHEWARAFEQCGLKLAAEHRRLDMYPWIADWLFGRSLHFIARLDVAREQAC